MTASGGRKVFWYSLQINNHSRFEGLVSDRGKFGEVAIEMEGQVKVDGECYIRLGHGIA